VPGIVKDENLHDGLRVTLVATGFAPLEAAPEEPLKEFKDFVLQNFQPGKAGATPTEREEASGEVSLDFAAGQYDIPAYLRRRLTHKALN